MADIDDPGAEIDDTDLVEIRRAMNGLAKAPTAPGGSSPRPGGPASGLSAEFVPQFGDLESWVAEFFAPTFGGQARRDAWCAQWWDHPEAVLRLDALWRTWEVSSWQDQTPLWVRDHLDPGLRNLFGTSGPFRDCTSQKHTVPSALPLTPVPPGHLSEAQHWWDVLSEPDR